jgi:hypothetical protein
MEEMKELMHNQKYHYKLIGDTPECLPHMLELDEAGSMHHFLHKCGLFDEKSKKYNKVSVIIDQHDTFLFLVQS